MVCIQLGKGGLGTLKFERVYTNQTPSITIESKYACLCSYYARREPSIAERVLAGISLVLGGSDEGTEIVKRLRNNVIKKQRKS
jgi:hypothetical protein